jgi:hypothetical protein
MKGTEPKYRVFKTNLGRSFSLADGEAMTLNEFKDFLLKIEPELFLRVLIIEGVTASE